MHRPLLLLLLTAPLAAQEPPAFRFLTEPPKGLPAMPLPEDRPAPTEAHFELGRRLFHDPVLSLDRTVSCASCHLPEHGFSHPDPNPPGVGDRKARRHAPVLWNRGYGRSQRWDGSTATLEEFVLQPIADPDEMALGVKDALQRLRGDADYRTAFTRAYQGGATEDTLAAALATFVRGIVRADAPYDRFVAGGFATMTRDQRAGLWLFESRGTCWKCHTPPLFTDEGLHNTGVGAQDGVPVPGRAAFTNDPEDTGRFKTPTLRGVADSAPYMHDGSLRTLEDVIEFYARGGNQNPHLDPHVRPLDLSAEDKANLLAFLKSL